MRPRRTVRSVKAHRYFADLSRNTFLLALASLFADISTEMLYPVLPFFLTQILKASGSVVGLVEGVAGATQNVVQGFSGSLSDKLQRRKPIASAPISYPARFLSDRLGRRNILVLSFAIFLATYLGFAISLPLVIHAIVCLIGASYVTELTGGGQLARSAVAAALLLIVIGLAAGGLRASAAVQVILVSLLTAVVVVAVAGSVPAARASNWTPFAPHGWLSLGSAAATLMFSFVGWEAVAPLTTIHRPRQTERQQASPRYGQPIEPRFH